MSTKYYQITEGEWIDVPKRGHQNACCSCALVHTIDYRTKNGIQQVRFRINRRATAAMRRPFKFSPDESLVD